MEPRIDLTGKLFVFLEVLRLSDRPPSHGNAYWDCLCLRCGRETTTLGKSLRAGTATKCRDCGYDGVRKHLMSKSPEYRAWAAMHARCRQEDEQNSPHYFDRGISVCERWNDFQNFLADMGTRPGPGYSIDRKKNELGYSPDNCRWATTTEQNRNRTDSHKLTVNGTNVGGAELAGMCGVHRISVYRLIGKGLSGDEIIAHFKSASPTPQFLSSRKRQKAPSL